MPAPRCPSLNQAEPGPPKNTRLHGGSSSCSRGGPCSRLFTERHFLTCPASRGFPFAAPSLPAAGGGRGGGAGRESLDFETRLSYCIQWRALGRHLASLGPGLPIHETETVTAPPSQGGVTNEEPGSGPTSKSVLGHQSCPHSLVSECSRPGGPAGLTCRLTGLSTPEALALATGLAT